MLSLVRTSVTLDDGAARFETRTADLGVPMVDVGRALQVAGELEDEELIRRQRRGA
jgi:hypothetical protein